MSWFIEMVDGVVCALGNTFPVKEELKGYGFRWNPNERRWQGAPMSALSNLWRYVKDPDLRARLQASHASQSTSMDASRAADSDIEIPKPSDQEFMPFQRAGVAYALDRAGVLFGDSMGLGKTVQVCGLINVTKSRRILIVCPASLRIVWKRHIQSWCVEKLPIFLANGRNDRQFARAVEMNVEGVYVINYDVVIGYVGLRKKLPENFDDLSASAQQVIKRGARWDRKGADGPLMRMPWDMVVGDEIHLIKNRKAQRTAAFTTLRGKRRVGVTGTPIVNHPREIQSIVEWIDPERWHYKAFKAFDVDECLKPVDKEPCGRCGNCRVINAMQNRLRETIMVRRLKRDVLTELPAKRRQVVELEPDGIAAEMVARQMLQWQVHDAGMKAAEAAAKAAQERNDEKAYRQAVDKIKGGYKVAFEEMSAVRRELALAKVPYAIDHIDAVLESGVRKLIVFAHHLQAIDGLREHYGDRCVVVDGRVDKDKRQACVDRFQSDDAIEVFIGGIIPAGVGLTLTAAAHVIFVELDWVPGNMTQAEDRAHRIGQANSVLVQHLVFAESLDANMVTTLVRKQRLIEQGLDVGERTASPAQEPAAVVVSDPEPHYAPPVVVPREEMYASADTLPF